MLNRLFLTLLAGLCLHPHLESLAVAERPPALSETSPRSSPDRTPPKAGRSARRLEFSRQPTVREISEARVFGESLVPIGREPTFAENAALAKALVEYVERENPDDFTALTDFLDIHAKSPWRAALLTCLGLEYFKAAYYSRALSAWEQAWDLGQHATEAKGKFLADRAVCELAGLYSRLGRMLQLEALLNSVEQRAFLGGATERIHLAREALTMMKHQPEVSFRCGPLALLSIVRSDPQIARTCSTNAAMDVFNSASTQVGFSLTHVEELSRKMGLNYRVAFRPGTVAATGASESSPGAEFVVPAVVHWRAGHYAAIVRRDGDRFLLQDPTFGAELWATRAALEAEASGYFVIPAGDLPRGWRPVDAREGEAIRGKGVTSGNDPNQYTCGSDQTASCSGGGCMGMPFPSVHLMLANLQIRDTPVGYAPPVGPSVYFTVRYNHRDYLQQPSETDQLLGPKWTHDWNERLEIDSATARYIVGGGGARVFTGFNPATSTYAHNQYDQALLRVTGGTYELLWPDGSKKIFGHPFGNNGFLLNQVVDSAGNAVTLTYDRTRLVALTDAIGQVTTLSYEHPVNPDLLTKVTDPFGRFATFDYTERAVALSNYVPPDENGSRHIHLYFLTKITDVLGLESSLIYQSEIAGTAHTEEFLHAVVASDADQMTALVTPYGRTSFTLSGGPPTTNNTRVVEITYPDRSKERIEYNQRVTSVPTSDPEASVPVGLLAFNGFLNARNTYYWNRTAMASSAGNYRHAKIYHWTHTESLALTAGVLESVKEPLEGRVWFNYPGHGLGVLPTVIGFSSRPTHIARVLDDGQTQLYRYEYNAFGNVTRAIDPVGRSVSYLYAENGIDLLEVRQTRAGNNELLARMTYNQQHQPLTTVDAAGQTNRFTYNARGQRLTATNPKGETTTYTYGVDGQLQRVDGPLPGTNDTFHVAYDIFGRVRKLTDLDGYSLTYEYDVMDRIVRVTYPDATYEELIYDRLNLATLRDRAGRQTTNEIDSMRQVQRQVDPLGRVTRFDWCRCGGIGSLTDPMGRTTSWVTDVQGRVTKKKFSDGSEISYVYENASSRLKHVVDEMGQVTLFDWNRDDTLNSIQYANALVPTPGVRFVYDPNYQRVATMVDGTGTTAYSYHPVAARPTSGAGRLASVDGPLPNDTVFYQYDESGRPVFRAIADMGFAMAYDARGRVIGTTNALGSFAYAYDGDTQRLLRKSLPNGQVLELGYGEMVEGLQLQRITHKHGDAPISEFLYKYDLPAERIATWSQQAANQSPRMHSFAYDAVNQLLSETVTNNGSLISQFAYAYDAAGNRVTERIGPSNFAASYNALNQLQTSDLPGVARTNEWNAEDRLVAVSYRNQRTEFSYDGLGRRTTIRHLLNGSEVSVRRLVWSDGEICEERNAAGAVIKRFFPQGVKFETGPNAGTYFYTRDHLGSIRELTDSEGNVRARYAYDPYGRRTKEAGDLETDFGFAGMFWCAEAGLSLTHFRAYDAELGRWLSRDPLPEVETTQGPNLYAYVRNNPINLIDPEGLCTGSTLCKCFNTPANFATCQAAGIAGKEAAEKGAPLLRNAPVVRQAVQCGQNAGPLVNRVQTLPGIGPEPINRLQTIPGIGPDTITGLERTVNSVARVAPPLRDMALLARRLRAYEESFADPANRFWQTWMDASRDWRENVLTQDQAREVVMWISRWTDYLF